MNKVRPNLMVSDIRKSIDFYQNILGFKVLFRVPLENETLMQDDTSRELRFAALTKGDIELFLQSRRSLSEDVPAFPRDVEIGATMTLYMDAENVDELYQNIKSSVQVVKPPETSWYGMRELYIRDPDGYVLAFGTQDGPPSS